jgi:hypothetical protein
MKQILIIFFSFVIACKLNAQQSIFYVSSLGNDQNPGSFSKPLKTLRAALSKVACSKQNKVSIQLRAGKYYQDKTIEITPSLLNNHKLEIASYYNEKVIISGVEKMNIQWKTWKGNILKAFIGKGLSIDRLFCNGATLPMARYPNFDSSKSIFNGTATDAVSPERVKKWHNPVGGYVHVLHEGMWGSFHYRITGKDSNDSLQLEGGWQNNRPAPWHKSYRFVENIFEELDAPKEWFYDSNEGFLYLYPPKDVNMKTALFEKSVLNEIITIKGTEQEPVQDVTIEGIYFTGTNRTFMFTKEPLLRSDWTIYRGGAILADGTKDIRISNCTFTELGGNAVFVSNYNRAVTISGNHVYNVGGNAIAFVGNPDAVRSPSFRYNQFIPVDELDKTPGPENNNFPAECKAHNNLIHNIGTVEKQVAGVAISMAKDIIVSHNTIYNVPRSGINIGDGCWGGNVIEFNDVFNTVLETGDHGAFNSWGRDRFWRPERTIIDSIVATNPGIELLDVTKPIIIRNNRFQCDHGWDIDLDDGSTNYLIYNNVCLNGGLKLREGYHRSVTNNILINNTFHPHVWLKNSGDVFTHNIVTLPYAPILMSNWGKEIDSNFFLTNEGLIKAHSLDLDKHSSAGNVMFVDMMAGNYHQKPGSPALKGGFKNFEMDFGVTLTRLKKIAEKPVIKPLLTKLNDIKGMEVDWLGAKFKNIETPGERSATGLPNNNGALLIQLPSASIAATNNLQKTDVIIKLGDADINSISDLLKVYQNIKWMGQSECTIIRNQATQKLTVFFHKL